MGRMRHQPCQLVAPGAEECRKHSGTCCRPSTHNPFSHGISAGCRSGRFRCVYGGIRWASTVPASAHGRGDCAGFRFAPRFVEWIKSGYDVYTDTSIVPGFAPDWLLRLLDDDNLGFNRVFLLPTARGDAFQQSTGKWRALQPVMTLKAGYFLITQWRPMAFRAVACGTTDSMLRSSL